MYIAKQPYKCMKCRLEFMWGSHDHHPAPVDSHGKPVCPYCWDVFLANIGVGLCTVAWTKDGSEYDRWKKEAL